MSIEPDRLEIAAADRAGEGGELGPLGSQTERRLPDHEGERQSLALELEIGDVHGAARRHPVVLLLVDVGHPGFHRRVGRHRAGELVDPLELHRLANVGQIQLALDREIHVGIRDRGPEHHGGFDRIAADPQVEPVELHHGAVGAAAGVGERQIQEDRTGRKRKIGILEGGVVHLGVDRKRREGAVAILALHPAVHGEAARGLHLVEVAGVHRRHQRQDAAEVGARRLEREIEAQELAHRFGGTGDAELEVVEAELGVLEGVGFLVQVGPRVGGEADLHPVEIGDPGEAHADGVGVKPSLDIDLASG